MDHVVNVSNCGLSSGLCQASVWFQISDEQLSQKLSHRPSHGTVGMVMKTPVMLLLVMYSKEQRTLWAPSQYPKRRLFVRSRKVSKPRDRYFKLSYRFAIWQAHRQHCCRSACQISERSDNSKYKSRGFEILRKDVFSDIEMGSRSPMTCRSRYGVDGPLLPRATMQA